MGYFTRGNGKWLQVLEKNFFFFFTSLALRCGMWASLVVAPWLNCYMVHYILVPRSAIELTSLDLESRFLTTGPSGKSWLSKQSS